MNSVFLALTALFLMVVVANLIRATRAIMYLRRESNAAAIVQVGDAEHSRKIVVVIPAMSESERLPGTIQHFTKSMKPWHSGDIIICTTAREPFAPGSGKSTYDLVKGMIDANPQQSLHLVHDPRSAGSMAHQINFAVAEMRRRGVINAEDYIAIYNADSRPHPETMKWVQSRLADQYTFDVFQQSALFLRNFDNLKGILAKANALYQSYWTLSHEIPRLLNQSQGGWLRKRFANAHCVGHGLFIRVGFFQAMGGMPEDTLTEDLNFGFRVRAMGKSIAPVPYLESADAPLTYVSAYRQKKIWFWGPMLYPYYLLQHLRAHRPKKLRATIIALQGWISAWRWVMAGPVVALVIGLALISGSSLNLTLTLAVVMLFCISAPMCVSIATRSDPYIPVLRYTPIELAIVSLACLPQIIAHSFAGLNTLGSGVLWAVTGRVPAKPRTQ